MHRAQGPGPGTRQVPWFFCPHSAVSLFTSLLLPRGCESSQGPTQTGWHRGGDSGTDSGNARWGRQEGQERKRGRRPSGNGVPYRPACLRQVHPSGGFSSLSLLPRGWGISRSLLVSEWGQRHPCRGGGCCENLTGPFMTSVTFLPACLCFPWRCQAFPSKHYYMASPSRQDKILTFLPFCLSSFHWTIY